MFRYLTFKVPGKEYITGSEFISGDITGIDEKYLIDSPIDFDPVHNGVFCYVLNEDGTITDESQGA